jgi:hypothetical protein
MIPNVLTTQDLVRSIEELHKAITTNAVQGLELVREDLQQQMAIVAPYDTPLRNRLNRKPGNGKAHAFYQLKAQADPVSGYKFIGTTPTNAFFAKGGVPTERKPQYNYIATPYVSLGDLIDVSFFEQQAGASYIDVRAHQIKVKLMNVAMIEEWCICNGDSALTPAGGGSYFDGLDKQIVDNVVDMQGNILTLKAINSLLYLMKRQGSKPQGLVLSYRDQLKFNELVLGSYYRLVQGGAGALADIPAGVSITNWISPFGRIDVLGELYLDEGYGGVTSAFAIDDKSVLEDGNAIEMVDLMGISAIDLAMIYTAYRTVVMEFTTMQVTAPPYQGKLINLGRDPNLF